MTLELDKIWALFTPREKRKAYGMFVLIVLMALAETAGVLSIMPFLSVLGRPGIIHQNPVFSAAYRHFHVHSARDFTVALGLVSIAIVITSSIFKTVTNHILNRFVHLQRHSISSRLLSRYLHQPYEFFLSRNSAVLSKHVLSEADQLQHDLIQPLAQLIAQSAVVLAMAILIFCYDPVTALCIVAVLGGLYGVIYGVVRKRLLHIGHERQAANAERYQACNEALGGIKDVKVTHSAQAYSEKFHHASYQFSRHSATNETLSQTPLYMVEATGYSGLIIIALILLLRSNDVAHVLPALGLYGFAAYRMLPAAQIMYRGFAKLRFASAALGNIHRDITLTEESQPTSQSVLTPRHEIRLENIRYAYPLSPERPVFEHFNLTIPANTSVGIIGKSGAGKSTLMDLLLGLITPQRGSLSVDGHVIDARNVTNWQRSIGYVPQHIYLADASVAENIAFGQSGKSVDMRAVEHAARAAQIHDFVLHELEDGYHTVIGERGIRLSGGQRQRIGIARALYRDPPVLFMDEATSALDAQTEEALNQAISTLSKSKTIIIITHKKKSLRYCQKITNLNNRTSID